MFENPEESHKPFRDVDANVQTVAAHNGVGVDTRGYRFATFLVNVGTIGSSATVDFKVQDSPDDSTYTDISGKSIEQITTSAQQAKVVVKCDGQARYLRGVLTVGTASSDAGSQGYLSGAKVKPVA